MGNTLFQLIVFLGLCAALKGAKAGERSRVEIVTIPPVTNPEPIQPSYCKGIKCDDTSHCTSVVKSSASCCPRCGCTNQFGRLVDENEKFRIEKETECYECKCDKDWRGNYGNCRKQSRCVFLTCKKQYKPPGKCCPTCGVDENAKDNSHRLPFPDFPDIPGF